MDERDDKNMRQTIAVMFGLFVLLGLYYFLLRAPESPTVPTDEPPITQPAPLEYPSYECPSGDCKG